MRHPGEGDLRSHFPRKFDFGNEVKYSVLKKRMASKKL